MFGPLLSHATDVLIHLLQGAKPAKGPREGGRGGTGGGGKVGARSEKERARLEARAAREVERQAEEKARAAEIAALESGYDDLDALAEAQERLAALEVCRADDDHAKAAGRGWLSGIAGQVLIRILLGSLSFSGCPGHRHPVAAGHM